MTREFAAMAELSVSVDVQASVDQAWAALTDWDRQGEWMLGIRVRRTVGDGRGVGGQIEAVTGIGRLRIRDMMRVTRWEPPHDADVHLIFTAGEVSSLSSGRASR
jgi:Polyketide cyclase / dehydrase and lipid transport